MLRISAPGVGLPYPQLLFPADLTAAGIAYTANTNTVSLAPGDTLTIPAGDWIVSFDGFSVLQRLDPVTRIWRGYASAFQGEKYIRSDGFTQRIANLTSCPVAAVVTNGGSGYVQSTTTVTASGGSTNSTWTALVGGAVAASVTTAGSGYTIAPMLFVDAPPAGGVPARLHCTLSGGAINAVVVDDAGAGYTTAPNVYVIPSPSDPNLANISPGAITATISGSAGKVTAVLCTNPGQPVSAIPALTISGAGSSAAATAEVMYTITSVAASGGTNWTDGLGFVTSTGGSTNASVAANLQNPSTNLTGYIPRKFDGVPTASAGALTGVTIKDGGLFISSNLSTNLPVLHAVGDTAGTNPSGALTLTPTLGGTISNVYLQQL